MSSFDYIVFAGVICSEAMDLIHDAEVQVSDSFKGTLWWVFLVHNWFIIVLFTLNLNCSMI